MEPTVIVTAAMSILTSLLQKAGEKAVETIGEKIGEKTVEGSVWNKVKTIFNKNEEPLIQSIEQKTVVSSTDMSMIESKLSNEIASNPQFALELKNELNINSRNEFLVNGKVASIKRLQEELIKLQIQMERAGVSVSGDFINKIELQQDKLDYQIKQLLALLDNENK